MKNRSINPLLALAATAALALVGSLALGGIGSPVYLDSTTGKTFPKQVNAGYIHAGDGGVSLMQTKQPRVGECLKGAATDGTTTTATGTDTTGYLQYGECGGAGSVSGSGTVRHLAGWAPTGTDTSSATSSTLGNSSLFELGSKLYRQTSAVSAANYFESYSASGGYDPAFYLRRSYSDTLGTLVQTIDGAYLGSLWAAGVGSDSVFRNGGWLRFQQHGTAGTGYVPTKLIIGLGDNTGASYNALVLDSDKTATIGGTLVAQLNLLILGNALITGTTSSTSTGTASTTFIGSSALTISVNVGAGANQVAAGNHTHASPSSIAIPGKPGQVLVNDGSGSNTSTGTGTATYTNWVAVDPVWWPPQAGENGALPMWSKTDTSTGTATTLAASHVTDKDGTVSISEKVNISGSISTSDLTTTDVGVMCGVGVVGGTSYPICQFNDGTSSHSIRFVVSSSQLAILRGGSGMVTMDADGIHANNITATPGNNKVPLSVYAGADYLNAWVSNVTESHSGLMTPEDKIKLDGLTGSSTGTGTGTGTATGYAYTDLSNLTSVKVNTSITPATTNSIDLGTSSIHWNELFCRYIDSSSDITSGGIITGNSLVSATTIVANGNITAGGDVSCANVAATYDISGRAGTFSGNISAANISVQPGSGIIAKADSSGTLCSWVNASCIGALPASGGTTGKLTYWSSSSALAASSVANSDITATPGNSKVPISKASGTDYMNGWVDNAATGHAGLMSGSQYDLLAGVTATPTAYRIPYSDADGTLNAWVRGIHNIYVGTVGTLITFGGTWTLLKSVSVYETNSVSYEITASTSAQISQPPSSAGGLNTKLIYYNGSTEADIAGSFAAAMAPYGNGAAVSANTTSIGVLSVASGSTRAFRLYAKAWGDVAAGGMIDPAYDSMNASMIIKVFY